MEVDRLGAGEGSKGRRGERERGRQEDSRREEGERDLEWQVTVQSDVHVILTLKGETWFE